MIGDGAMSTSIRFNDDSGNNYNYRRSVSGAADTTSVNLTNLPLRGFTDRVAFDHFLIVNFATQEKQARGEANTTGTAGAGNASDRVEFVGKWANTADQINRIDYIDGGAGQFDNESELLLEGNN